jgi:hypothetical protein
MKDEFGQDQEQAVVAGSRFYHIIYLQGVGKSMNIHSQDRWCPGRAVRGLSLL